MSFNRIERESKRKSERERERERGGGVTEIVKGEKETVRGRGEKEMDTYMDNNLMLQTNPKKIQDEKLDRETDREGEGDGQTDRQTEGCQREKQPRLR